MFLSRTLRTTLVAALAAMSCLCLATAAPEDGAIVDAVKLVDRGPDSDVPTIVFLSEGYQTNELPAYAEAVALFVTNFLATHPFNTECHPYNIWRVDVSSADSGVDDPDSCPGGTGLVVNTYFDGSLCGNGVDRDALWFDDGLAAAVLDTVVPDWDGGIVLANSDVEAWTNGNPWATTTAGPWIEDLILALLPTNQPPVCDAGGPYLAECEGERTPVTLSATNSVDPDCDPLTFTWTGAFVDGTATGETVTLEFEGVGVYPVLLDVSDGMVTSRCETMVTIEDTTPPDLAVMVEPYLLWPPNHKYEDITAEVTVMDICDADVQVRLVSVTSSEPDNGKGDGNTTDDIYGAEAGADDRSFQLRAERSGKGKGRVYSIVYQAEDASGNMAEVQAFVVVPKSQGKGGLPCRPDGPVTVMPTQEDLDTRLHYRWEAEPCANLYEVRIDRDGRLWRRHWYRKGYGVGHIHEIIDDHVPGRYDWRVRGWGPGGMGPWSKGPSFTLARASDGETPPDEEAPGDGFRGDEVVLSWNYTGAGEPMKYEFNVKRGKSRKWRKWIKVEDISVDGDRLSYEIPRTLPPGEYRWWYRTYRKGAGRSRWTEAARFTVVR